MDEPRNPSEEPLPGSVSDQNHEEAEPGHDATSQSPNGAGGDSRSGGDSDAGDDSRSRGESSEGSQSTGNPRSAG
jgi:hypothetical protein